MLFNQFLKGHKAFVEEQRKVQGSTVKQSLTISRSRLEFGRGSAVGRDGRTIWIADAHRGD
jgi:hypothetical protein